MKTRASMCAPPYQWAWDLQREWFICTRDGVELCRVSRKELIEADEHPAVYCMSRLLAAGSNQ